MKMIIIFTVLNWNTKIKEANPSFFFLNPCFIHLSKLLIKNYLSKERATFQNTNQNVTQWTVTSKRFHDLWPLRPKSSSPLFRQQCCLFFFSFIFISWRLIILQNCSGFSHTLTWLSHGFTCVPHPDLPSHLPLHPFPLGLPSAPGPSTCLMHPTWAGDLIRTPIYAVLPFNKVCVMTYPQTLRHTNCKTAWRKEMCHRIEPCEPKLTQEVFPEGDIVHHLIYTSQTLTWCPNMQITEQNKHCPCLQGAVISSVQFSSVAQSCPTLCDPVNRSRPGLPVHDQCRPLSSCPQSLPASGSFQMSQLFAWGGQSTGVSASASVLPMNTQDWSPLGWTGWISLKSKGLSGVFSNTTVQKHQFFSAQLSSQSNSHIHTWPLEKP